MYIPSEFQIDDPEVLSQFMQRYNFGTLVSQDGDGALVASHIPFVVDAAPGRLPTLFAHVAKANRQWRSFGDDREALVIFQGPHGYVSPSLYEVHPSVPTWNYQVVHAYGAARLLTQDEQRSHVFELIEQHESGAAEPWQPDLPEDLLDQLLRQIVAFRIDVTRLEGKFKLNQNRSEADRESVTVAFESSSDPLQRELGRSMRVTPRLPD